jgi:hypothetical protein
MPRMTGLDQVVCGVHSVPLVPYFAVSLANWGHPRACGLIIGRSGGQMERRAQ